MDELPSFCTALDLLCPMHLVLSDGGQIVHAGPTVRRLLPDTAYPFAFTRGFQISKPERCTVKTLSDHIGQSITAVPRSHPNLKLKGVCVQVGDYFVLNLSFGLSAVEAVKTLNLTNADFAPTDLTVAMLYLAEAKTMALEEFRNLSQRLEGAKRLAELDASTDPLTGLLNRRGFDELVGPLLASSEPFAVLQIDLDHFKAVNDGMGHAAGDELLQKTAYILRQETRKGDLICRNGGDEFTLVLRDVSDPELARDIGERIVLQLKKPLQLTAGSARISASVGIAWSDNYARDGLGRIFQDADKALYSSKAAGRGRQTCAA